VQSLVLAKCPNAIEAEHKVNTGDLQNTNQFILRRSIPNRYKHKARLSDSDHLAMFEFLGLLFGCCIRTAVKIPIDVASFVWKAIAHGSLNKRDLLSIDKNFYDLLEGLRSMNQKQFEETFGSPRGVDDGDDDKESDDMTDDDEQQLEMAKKQTELYFTTMLSDKETSVELKPNGNKIRVTFENRLEYIKLCYEARLNEHETLVEAIRRGMDKIVPMDALNVMDWRELEILICGKKEIDVNLLRRHTTYSSPYSASDQHIVWFWEVLSEFNQENRIKFVRFAWAQERLPSDDDEFTLSKTRLQIKQSSLRTANQDSILPKSDTCFFNLELPKYTSKQALRDKLVLAITVTMSMNGDDPGPRGDDMDQFRDY